MGKMSAQKSMTLSASLGIIVIGLVGIAAYFFLFHRANPPLKHNEIKIGRAMFSVEVVRTTVERARGLSFRPGLTDGGGMLFLFGSPAVQRFWMKDMRFPLDMIWIGGNTVLGFAENVPPPARGTLLWGLPVYRSPAGTDAVLEVNAGAVKASGIEVGDAVEFGI